MDGTITGLRQETQFAETVSGNIFNCQIKFLFLFRLGPKTERCLLSLYYNYGSFGSNDFINSSWVVVITCLCGSSIA